MFVTSVLVFLLIATILLTTVNLTCDTSNPAVSYDISLQDAPSKTGVSVLVHNYGNQPFTNVTLSVLLQQAAGSQGGGAVLTSTRCQLYKSYFIEDGLPLELDAAATVAPNEYALVLPHLPAARSALIQFASTPNAAVTEAVEVTYTTTLAHFTPYKDLDFRDNGPVIVQG